MKIKLKVRIRKPGVKKREGNSNQMELRLKKPVALAANVKEEIKKICLGIKGLLSVKIIMSGEKTIGITITGCDRWEDKEFVKEVKNKLKEAIEEKT